MQSALLGQCSRRSVQSFYELIYTTKLSSVSSCVSETFVLLLLTQVTLNQLCDYYDFIIDKIVIDNIIADRWLLSDWFWCCSFTLFFFVLAFPTERWELQLVARKFERRGLISYKEFVAALKAVSFFFSIISLYFKCVFLYQVC